MKKILFLTMILLFSSVSFAHVIVNELENMSKSQRLLLYLELGYKHILPLGLDHILFILSLFLISTKVKSLLLQASAFTLAHTLTLGLASYGFITPVPSIIEPLISLSIAFMAFENILSRGVRRSRIVLIFCFGLVHGLGFSSALSSLGLPSQARVGALFMFNIGVELGQLTIIFIAYFVIGRWFGEKNYYRKAIMIPLSMIIMVIATYWTIERLLVV